MIMAKMKFLQNGLLSLLFAAALAAHAEDLVTGPPAGTTATPISCYANTGPYAGSESFDAAGLLGDGPGAFLFVHVLNRNTAPVIRGVDNLGHELGLFGFKSFVVTLSDDRTAAEESLRRVNGSLKLHNPMVLSLDGLDGPGNYALNRRCTLSLITMNQGKVVGSIGFTDTGLYDLERIRKLAYETLGEVPTRRRELLKLATASLPRDVEALRELAAKQAVELYQVRRQASEDHANSRRYGNTRMQRGQMNAQGRARRMERGQAAAERQRPAARSAADTSTEAAAKAPKAAPKRRGGPPSDARLESLLRSFIRKTNDSERTKAVFADITSRAAETDDLTKQAIAMFQLMLSFPDRYGTEQAQNLARKFLADHGTE